MPKELRGIAAAPGVVAGPVRHMVEPVTDLGQRDPPSDPEAEIARAHTALAEVAEALEKKAVGAADQDVADILSAQAMVRPESCNEPAGASPVRGGAEAPGSRPPSDIERRPGEAWCQEPLWREQERGPQHQVNSAASTEKQWESRAAHFTVKATSDTRDFGVSASDLPGVWEAARSHGSLWNRRDPSRQPRQQRPVA